MKIAVLGAHLSGLPLNSQLLDRGATLVRATRTKPIYRFYALPGTTPPKPGMIRVAEAASRGIELEVWDLPAAAFGEFISLVSSPLCIGTIELEDGEQVKGFLVEPYAIANAKDITDFGGWRSYLSSLKSKS